MFCLIVFSVLFSCVLVKIWAKRKGRLCKSGGGFCCFLIVLISLIAANIVIPAAGRCPAAAGGARSETNRKKRTIGVCPIVFGGLSLGVLYGLFTKGVRKKQGTLVGVVLLEALAGRFICFGESDVNQRVCQRGRIEGLGGG